MLRISTLLFGAVILQLSLAAVVPAPDNIAQASDLSPRGGAANARHHRQRSADDTMFTNDHQFVYTGSDAGSIYQYPTPPPPSSTQKPKKPTSEFGLKPDEDGVSLQFDFVHKPAFFKRRDDRPLMTESKSPEASNKQIANKPAVPKQHHQDHHHHHHHRYVNPYVAAYGQLPSVVRNMWKDWKARLSTVRRNGNNNLNLHPASLLSAIPARLGGKISKSGQPHAAATAAAAPPSAQNRIAPIGYKVAFKPSLE